MKMLRMIAGLGMTALALAGCGGRRLPRRGSLSSSPRGFRAAFFATK